MNQESKELVWRYWQRVNDLREETSLFQILHPAIIWHGFQPSRHLRGLDEIWSRFWHPQMVWHGPAGIGTAYGLEAFKKNAQGPIGRAFPDRRVVGHGPAVPRVRLSPLPAGLALPHASE